MKNMVMIMILSVAVGIITANAQQPKIVVSDEAGWHKIGETTVDFKKETDEIAIIGADRFATIKFKVTKAPIVLSSAVVYFEDGETQNVSVKMKAQGESEVIDLNGGERNLNKIVFVYKTSPNKKDDKANVEIWGLKINADKKK